MAAHGTAPASWLIVGTRFWVTAGGYWRLPETRRHACLLIAALLGAILLEVGLLLRFNTWNRDLFNALEAHDAHGVLVQSGVLVAIVVGMGLASGGQMLARRRLALGWRRWLTQRLTAGWIAAGGSAPANVDGRIAEDARVSTEDAVELVASLVHAFCTSAGFIGVLWALSDHAPIQLGGIAFHVPGYLLWLALLYACGGMAVALLAGRPLIRSTDARQAREAEYRAALVRTRDQANYDREAHGLLHRLFHDLAEVFDRQSRAYAGLEFFVCIVTRLGLGLPYLVATPAYLAGVASLGWLMQAAQAFQTVTTALGWPVANMPRIATWRASAERVLALAAMAPAPAGPPPPATTLARPAITG
jgi:putative ATP-binding cassette transporter